jgi:hypothetical protein
MIRSSKKKLSQRRMVIALDKDCRLNVVVIRDENTCQRCRKKQGEWDAEISMYVRIQWAHIHTREYYVTRWEADNSLALCSRCHVWFDYHKVLSYEWFRKNWPERWERIKNVLNSGAKVKVKGLYEEMKADPPGKSQYMAVPKDEEIPY